MQEALDIDQYSIAICIFPRDKVAPSIVDHFPRELSRIFDFFTKRGGKISGCVHSTEYKRSPIPEGLELPLVVSFVVMISAKSNLLLLKSMRGLTVLNRTYRQ